MSKGRSTVQGKQGLCNNGTENASPNLPTGEKKANESTLINVLSFTADKIVSTAAASSIVGEKMSSEGVTVFPVSSVSVGFAGGGADIIQKSGKQRQNPAGAGAKLTKNPSAFVVIKNGRVRIVSASENRLGAGISEALGAAADGIKKLLSAKK